MKALMTRLPAGALTVLAGLVAGQPALAQSVCASNGQPQPTALVERFINADCDTCWQDAATPKAARGQIALDWVVPGSKGDDAPLSAVATRDGLGRLESRRETVPAASSAANRPVRPMKGATLRVARGLPLSGYIGASIALKPVPAAAQNQPWTAWLALVETLPAGLEGSPVERNLVRNAFQTSWDGRKQLSKDEQSRFFDQRSMSVADSADPARLRLIGWVEDARGQVVAAAVSKCQPETP
jgi:hypothetical protein